MQSRTRWSPSLECLCLGTQQAARPRCETYLLTTRPGSTSIKLSACGVISRDPTEPHTR